MAEGMRPGIYHNPDPTYEKTKTNLNRESKRVRCEVEAFFEEIRRCRKHIDSLNQYRLQCEMDMISLRGCRYDKEAEELRIKELNRYGDMITRGFRLLALLSDPEQKSIMIDRYFLNKIWEKIAQEHHYARTYCYDLKNKAFREISKKAKPDKI